MINQIFRGNFIFYLIVVVLIFPWAFNAKAGKTFYVTCPPPNQVKRPSYSTDMLVRDSKWEYYHPRLEVGRFIKAAINSLGRLTCVYGSRDTSDSANKYFFVKRRYPTKCSSGEGFTGNQCRNQFPKNCVAKCDN